MSPAAYRARKAARVCVRCRAGLQLGDGVRCVECQAEARAWDNGPAGAAATKRKRDKRRGKGQCHDCSSPAVEGRSRCQRHLDEHAAATNRYLMRKEGA